MSSDVAPEVTDAQVASNEEKPQESTTENLALESSVPSDTGVPSAESAPVEAGSINTASEPAVSTAVETAPVVAPPTPDAGAESAPTAVEPTAVETPVVAPVVEPALVAATEASTASVSSPAAAATDETLALPNNRPNEEQASRRKAKRYSQEVSGDIIEQLRAEGVDIEPARTSTNSEMDTLQLAPNTAVPASASAPTSAPTSGRTSPTNGSLAMPSGSGDGRSKSPSIVEDDGPSRIRARTLASAKTRTLPKPSAKSEAATPPTTTATSTAAAAPARPAPAPAPVTVAGSSKPTPPIPTSPPPAINTNTAAAPQNAPVTPSGEKKMLLVFDSSAGITAGAGAGAGATAGADEGSSSDEERARQGDNDPQYQRYLEIASRDNFSDIAMLNILYETPGKDAQGRSIFVFVAANIPAKEAIDYDRLFLFLIKSLDKRVEAPYALVYVHSNFKNRPNVNWMKQVYGIFNRKYKKNLKALYIVDASFWLKAAANMMRPFLSKKFWKKLHYCKNLAELFQYIPPEILALPHSVFAESEMAGAEAAAAAAEALQVFGSTIADLMSRPDQCGAEAPIFMEKAITYLRQPACIKSEGLFRISASKKQLNELIEFINRGMDVDFDNLGDPHVATGLLKQFIRDLREPILTYALYQEFLSILDEPDHSKRVVLVHDLIARLPAAHISTLSYLMRFLCEVATHSEVNKMHVPNLCIVFGPSLIRSKTESTDLMNGVADMAPTHNIVRILLEHYDYIFAGGPLVLDAAAESKPMRSTMAGAAATVVAAQPVKAAPKVIGPPTSLPPLPPTKK